MDTDGEDYLFKSPQAVRTPPAEAALLSEARC